MKGQTSEELAVLRREFSELAGLQTAGCITYSLCKRADELYIAAQENALPARKCAFPGQDAAQAELLLRYLYENAVSPQQINDVIRDLHPGLR